MAHHTGFTFPLEALNFPQPWGMEEPPMNFHQCKAYLEQGLKNGGLRHVDALAHILGIAPRSPWFKPSCEAFVCYNDHLHAHVMPLDAEWYESNHSEITELGFGSVSVYSARSAISKNITDYLASMSVHHIRIMENAHMVNGRRCAGNPEEFQFGRTGFATRLQGQGLLHSSLMKYDDDYVYETHPMQTIPEPRPIIIIGHAVSNDLEEFNKYLGIDLTKYRILMTLDTQVMAREVGITGPNGPNISLKNLLEHYGITKDTFLHNAGNDAAFTMIAGCLLAHNRFNLHGEDISQMQKDVDNLKSQIRQRQNTPVHGIPQYCTRCDSRDHMASNCVVQLFCTRCADKYPEKAKSHSLQKCLVVSNPCERCLKSPKPKLHQNADTHTTNQCIFVD